MRLTLRNEISRTCGDIGLRRFLISGAIVSAGLLQSLNAQAIVFDMAPLEFSNRAACAELSTKPARSVFLQMDAFNAGKAGFAQGLIAQKSNPTEVPGDYAQMAVKDFRIWSTRLAVGIANDLLSGKLPLLPQDGSTPAIFQKTVESCLSRKDFLSCQGMNNFLADLWARSKMADPHWEQLGFASTDFFPQKIGKTAAIGCHIVRKFSALHSPLKTQTIEAGTITNIAMDAFKPEEHLDSCFSTAEGADPRFTTVQIDIARLAKDGDWDTLGFPFWHSLKLFMSWAWRYAPEYRQEFGPFEQVFTSLAYEDSVMLLPNGCRSIEMPRCDSQGLASDTMRAAKYLGMTSPAVDEVPQKPIDTLFTGKTPPVNSDVLGVFKANDASAWARDFKDKLSGIRFSMMKKLNTGIDKLQIITSLVEAKDLAKDIKIIQSDASYDKIETYLACMEFTLAKNDLYQDIFLEIQTLNQADELKSVLLSESGRSLDAYVAYYKTISETMEPFCKEMEKRGRLTSPMPTLYKSLREWAFDLVRPMERSMYLPQCALTPNIPECPQNLDKKYLVAHPKSSTGVSDEFTICKTSLECARTVLESLVSIVSVRRMAHAFLPTENVIASPDLFNTYAMPTACKLYDPWSKQRNSWKLFVADLGSALVYGATCGALKFQVLELPTSHVTGYKEISETNQSLYEPVMGKDPLKYVAGVDYAFLPGFSCGVAVANVIAADQQKYLPGYFSSLKVQNCKGDSSTDYTINRHPQLDPSMNKVISGMDKNVRETCFSCSIALTSVAKYSCVTPIVGQAVATGIGLFQGTMRLISNLSDKDNIIRAKVLDVDQVSQSFSDLQKITPKCHRKLKRGTTCH